MPIQVVKDPQTGEEKQVYVAPKGMGNAPKPAAKPKQQQGGLGGLMDAVNNTPIGVLTSLIQAGGTALGTGVNQLQQGRDLGQAFGAGQRAYMQTLEGPGAGKAIARTATNATRNFLQETSDLLTADIPAAFGDTAIKPTSKEMPDAPFLGFLPPLAKARSSGPAEDLATGIAQVAIEWFPATKAVGLVGKGLKVLPGAAGVAAGANRAAAGYQAAKAAQIGKLAPRLQKPATVVAGAGEAVASNVLGKGAATGALIDFAGFDQNEGRLYDLADSLKQKVTGTPLEIPFLDYLKSRPGDAGVQGRLKNAVEGAFVGSTVEFLMRAFRAGKYVERLRNAAPEDKPAAAAAAKEATEDLQREMVKQANTVPEAPRVNPYQQAREYTPQWENGPEIQNNLLDPRNPQPVSAQVAAPAAPTPTPAAAAPAPEPAPAAAAPVQPIPDMQAPVYRDVAEVDPQTIVADPQRFQFKEAGRLTKTGASGSLAESSGYNPELAGIISVWRDPADGVAYVVNGHNRLRLAKDDGTGKVLVRYLQAETAEEARAIGALQNIAEGNGTPVDAAKFMRDTGKSPEDMAAQGINMGGPVIAKAVPLTNLPQNLFDKVTTGQLDLAKAIALGSEPLDGQVINDVAAEAIKRKWSAEKITQAMQEAKFAQTETQGGGLLDMLGDEWANKTSNFNQLLDVRTEAFRALREEMVALTSAAREGRKGILEAAGNVIDVAGSRAARDQASAAVEVFNRVTAYKGPVRDLLNEMAGQIKGKRTAKVVVGENLDRLRQAIDDELNGPSLPLEQTAPAAATPEPSVPSAGSSAPVATPAQSAETKALLDRALAVLPPEKRAAVQAELQRRAQEPAAPTGGIDIPAAAAGRLSPNRETSAAESLLNWVNSGIPGEQQAIQTLDDALELVRAKGQVLDPDKVPGLDMDAARNDKAMGRNTPATQAVADAYKQFYGIGNRAQAAPAAANEPTFALPAELQRSAPRYGMATVNFASDLDRAAYVLANDAVKPSKAAPKFRQAVEDAGLDVADVVAHGRKVKQAIKDAAGGGAAPQQAMQLDIADQGFGGRGVLANYEVFQPDPNQRRLDPEFIQSFTKELTEDIRRVAGDDVAIRYQQAFELQQRPKEWGGTGDPKEMSYVNGYYDPIQDLIQLNGIGTKGINTLRQTAFHEAFHRVQFNFLTEGELKALNSFWGQLKLGFGADATVKAAAKQGRKVSLIEQQAIAFQRYAYAKKEGLDVLGYMSGAPESELYGQRVAGADAQGRPVYRDATGKEQLVTDVMLKGISIMDTLLDFIEKANNFIRGRGWTSTKSIFEQAYSGKLAETRQGLGNAYAVADEAMALRERVAQGGEATIEELRGATAALRRSNMLNAIRDMNVIPLGGADNRYRGRLYQEADEVPVNAPTPDEAWATRFVDQILANRAAIEAGELTVDDLLANNVQKLESPSGATKYQPIQPAAMVEAYRAHGDLVSRPDATGIPVMTDEQIISETADWLEKANYSSKAVLDNLKRLSGPLSAYKENLVAMRAAALYVDHTNLQAGIAANRWLNAAADEAADMSKLTAELVTAAAQQDRANRAFESVTRPLGQLLRNTQVPRPEPGSIPFREGDTAADAVIDVEVVTPGKDIATDFEKELVKDQEELVADTIGEKISPEAKEAIITGQYDNPKVIAEFNALALNMAQSAVTPGFSQGFWRKFNEGVNLGAQGLMMYRSSQLLSSGITFWGNVINSALRTVELPFTQAMGALVTGHPIRASRSLMIYGQYVSNLANAFRMGVESFKVGRGLFDLDRSQVDFLDRLAAQDAQGEMLSMPQKGEWSMNTVPWVSVQDKSNWAMAQKRLWQGLNLSSRLQVSADSAFKTMVGQSFEYVRNLQPGLDHAIRLGMDGNSAEAWKFAQDYAQAAVDKRLKDLTIDGKTILDGVMDSPYAQTATRWATFTDDIWAQMEPRTMARGMELAQAKGLKEAEATAFAEEYVKKGVKVAGMGMDDIPFFARTFSLMPQVWQMGLDSPLAPLFALVQPFNRTPGDIVKSVARKTPLAPLVDTWWRDVFSEDAMTRDRAWGDIATGAAAISLASIAMTHGRIEFTGGGPTNPDARRKWMDQEGKQSYSMRFRTGTDENGNPVYTEWISMRALDPYASLFGGLADYHELANKVSVEARERLGSALVMDLVTAVAGGQLQKSYYQGFTELYEMAMAMGETDIGPNRRHPTARYIERLIASFIPGSSSLRAGRRIEDPVAREVPASNSNNLVMRLFEETMGEIKNAIPGWSTALPPKRNWITGDPVILSGVWGDQFLPPESPWLSYLLQFNPASPFQTKGEPGERVLREMGSLTGRGAGFVGPRSTDFTDGGKIKANRLSPAEYEQYVLAISRTPDQFGRTLLQALEEEIDSDLYKSNPQEAPSEQVVSLRAAALNQVIAKYLQLGRETFLSGPYGKRLMDNKDWAEGANRDVQFRLKYGQEIDPQAFVESLR